MKQVSSNHYMNQMNHPKTYPKYLNLWRMPVVLFDTMLQRFWCPHPTTHPHTATTPKNSTKPCAAILSCLLSLCLGGPPA